MPVCPAETPAEAPFAAKISLPRQPLPHFEAALPALCFAVLQIFSALPALLLRFPSGGQPAFFVFPQALSSFVQKDSLAACIFQSASRIPGTMIARFNSRLRFFEPCRSTFRSTGLSTSPAVPHSLFSALRKEGGAVSRLLLLRKDPYFPRYSTMASPASIPLVSAQPTPQEPGKFAPSTPPTTSPAA